ncbi:MAG: DUF2304 domain-containing protein [Anaerolineae bacterium]
MHLETRIFLLAGGAIILFLVVNLVRTRRLKEEFALLWLGAAVLMVLAPLGLVDLLDKLAYAVGIEYPPALIFTIAVICLLGILFQFSLRISRFSDQIKVLAQEIALLRHELEGLQRHTSQGGEHAGQG